ncbi:monooxygenase [Crucibulum laeve]|uniref:Monooxygenase n=1 Tax=Crucibulum laeve TaxID=68775 RepID=A0A5C3M2T2_9AGAR|nr:monooxygenase [Crucibulum laeve]
MESSKSGHIRHSQVLCIGAGVAGLAVVIQLQQRLKCRNIHIYDRNASPGGVWAVQKYPGVACDIPAELYSFSFASKTAEWSKFRPGGAEFEQYLRKLATDYNLWPLMTFKTECERAIWNEKSSTWLVTLRDINSSKRFEHSCNVLCMATGQLVDPKAADIPGLANFQGPIVHTSSWDPQIDIEGKRIAVFGNGASGSQLVPVILPKASSILHICRSPQWYISATNIPYGRITRWILRNIPLARRLLRFVIFAFAEMAFRGISLNARSTRTREKWQRVADNYMKSKAPEKYHDVLIPKYSMGCKRPVFNNGYLECLHNPKVQLLRHDKVKIESNRIVYDGEGSYPVDAIILATGYETHKCIGVPIIGRKSKNLEDHWNSLGGPSAYGTVAVHNFPNLFLLKGPNTATGHTSAILLIENVVNLVIKAVAPLIRGDSVEVEVTAHAEIQYAKSIQAASRKRVWYSGCKSWYIREDGWNAMIYPWSQIYCWWFSFFPDWEAWSYKR